MVDNMTSKKLLFSITVHESYDSINELIRSINKSYEDSYIVLHINYLWRDFEDNKIENNTKRVFINKKYRYPLYNKMEGKTGIHFSNIEYFNTLNIDYDYVIICASNELYIKPIDIEYIDSKKYGSDFLSVSTNSIFYKKIPHIDSSFIKSVIGDSLKFIYNKNGIFGGRHEGMFFQKELAEELVKIYRKNFSTANNLCRCDEEIIPHTILYNIVDPTDTESICHFSNRQIDYSLIKNFYEDKIVDFSDLFTKFDTNVMYKYSIKGIDRNNRNLRKDIENLIGY